MLQFFYNLCVLQAQGVCVENAVTPPGEQSQLPSMLCGEDGQWVGQPTSSCSCRPGYEAGETDVRCRGKKVYLLFNLWFGYKSEDLNN